MDIPTIDEVLTDPAASYWLKDALRAACGRDVVDVANDAELLSKLLSKRNAEESEREYWQQPGCAL